MMKRLEFTVSILNFALQRSVLAFVIAGWVIFSSVFSSNFSYAVPWDAGRPLSDSFRVDGRHGGSEEVWIKFTSEAWRTHHENRANGLDAKINEVESRVNQLNHQQDSARTRAVENINKSIKEIKTSLRGEFQKFLLAQTCEDEEHEIPVAGTPGRNLKVAAKLDCITIALNAWRGFDEEGRPIHLAGGNGLTREQIVQMLRVLEGMLQGNDPDLTTAQRRFIVQTQRQFAYFNFRI